jgi:C-terminal processing protease CtpA/Prc
MMRAFLFCLLVLAAFLPAKAQLQPNAPITPLPPAGIGAILNDQKGAAVITQILPHSPAEKAGLRAQDKIVWVDYRDVAGMKLQEVVNLIRGDAGTTVAITVKHPGDPKPHTFTLVRAPITFAAPRF